MGHAVAILGGGRSWIRAPFADPSWQVWAHASCCEGMARSRVDRWYDVHRPDVRASAKTWSPRYQAWLRGTEDRTAPVYVLDGFPPAPAGVSTVENTEIPGAVVIPRAEIQAWLEARGAVEQEYTTSTSVWMFKQALYEGATLIGLWGIDYEEHAEYLVQRPCLEYWIGFARALGVTVYVTPTSPLGRDAHVYGFDGYRPDLVHTHQPFVRAKVQRVRIAQATGAEPMHEIPAEIQALIDEELARGVDTAAEWAAAARAR